MCTKGVWQLKELTLRFCATGGGSRGARDFLREELTAFAEANPQLTIKAEHRPNKPALLKGSYVCGTERQVDLSNASVDRVLQAATAMRNQTGRRVTLVREPVKTKTPSVQGFWDTTTDLGAFAVRA